MATQQTLPFTDKPVHIVAQQVGDKWQLVGETWMRRRLIQKAGGKWNDKDRAWEFPGAIPASLHPLVTTWLGGAPAPATARTQPSQPAPTVKPADTTTTLQPDSIIAPSYWDLLWLYTTPGRCRPGIALVGPAGNGKTTAAEEVLRLRGIDYLVIDANVTMEPFDLIGGMSYETSQGSGKQVWKDGPVTRAFREGKGVIINEFDSLDPRTALCLQSALQGKGATNPNRYITLSGNPDEDRVYPQGDCPLILTMNTFGSGATRLYTGRNTLDAASRDRLTLISTTYENEDKILMAHGYAQDTATRLLRWAGTTRQHIDRHELPIILGMRTLLGIAELVDVFGIALEQALEMEFYSVQEADTVSLLR
jgi:hypothetical protein